VAYAVFEVLHRLLPFKVDHRITAEAVLREYLFDRQRIYDTTRIGPRAFAAAANDPMP